MERFFSLSHLTRERLHDLYRDACKVGRRDIYYAKQIEQEYYWITLPEGEILRNIRSGNSNYVLFRQNTGDYEDATTVAFPLAEHPYVTVYIDIDNSLFDRFAEKYGLDEWWQMEGGKRRDYPLSEFYRTMTMIPGRPAVN
jgi:hypothetical protein